MKIKSSLVRLASTILALILGGALLRAQPSASTNESETNAITVPANSAATNINTLSASNISAAAVSKYKHKNPPPLSSEYSNFWNDKAGFRAAGLPPMGVHWENGRDAVFMKTIVDLVAVMCPFILVFGLPVAIVGTVFYFRHRQNKLLHETVRAMIEKGLPITPELLAGLRGHQLFEDFSGQQAAGNSFDQLYPRREKARNRRLLPGLILSGVGLALIFGLPEHGNIVGWVVFFIGLAFLIVWLVDRNEARNYDRNVAERKENKDPQPPKQ